MTDSDARFAGKVAVVTGGGTGIGRAVCLALAQGGAAGVVVNYSRSETDALAVVDELATLGCAAVAVGADVRDAAAVRSMMNDCVTEFGSLDYLVNNAGATRLVPIRALDQLTEEDWDTALDVNLRGAFTCMREAAPALSRAHGAIVSVASISAYRGAGSSIAYSVSKAGLLQLTRAMAVALAPEVRVNSVSPGTVASRWLGSLHGEDAARAAAVKESEMIPLGRIATPEDVAQVIVDLLAATFVTGQDVIVDGGKHLRY
jgi:NAD(P)-dependent dehydrogenase (short-subunit alcohol dehydrogenase family)